MREICYLYRAVNEARLQAEKRRLRNELRAGIAGIDRARRSDASAALAALLGAWPGWREAVAVLSFSALSDEIDTRPIHLMALAARKALGLPRIAGGELVFHRVEQAESLGATNRFGIREPSADAPPLSPPADGRLLLLVPGRAFDRQGRRLGRGGGYYDRFIAGHPGVLRVGVCYELQLVERVPAGPVDARVDWIATELQILRVAGPSDAGDDPLTPLRRSPRRF